MRLRLMVCSLIIIVVQALVTVADATYFHFRGAHGEPGDTVWVSVCASLMEGIKGYSVSFKFDPQAFEILDMDLDGTLAEGAFLFQPGWDDSMATPGTVYSFTCPGIESGVYGAILNVQIHVKETAVRGEPQRYPFVFEDEADPAGGKNRLTLCPDGSTVTPDLRNTYFDVPLVPLAAGSLNFPRSVFIDGRWATYVAAHLSLPEPYSVKEVSSVILSGPRGSVYPDETRTRVEDTNGDGVLDLILEFNGWSISTILECGVNAVSLSGLVGEAQFEATGELRLDKLQEESIAGIVTVQNVSEGISSLCYDLPYPGYVRLRVFDVRGRVVFTPYEGYSSAGTFSLRWNRRGDVGSGLAPGVYYCHVELDGETLGTNKLVILK